MKTNTITAVPRLRFPEFQGDENWFSKKLNDIATFHKGKGISKADISENGNQPCIRYGELYTYYKEIIDDVISFTNIPYDNLVLSEANDVIVPASGETKEDISTASCVTQRGIALGGDLNIIRSDLNGIFLSYYLNSAKKTEISKLAQGISVVHLYSSQLKKLTIDFPKSKEQKKIADCLSSLNDSIEVEIQQLESLKTHKAGLLQKLFPVGEETTPKYRFAEFESDGDWAESSLSRICNMKAGTFVSASEIKDVMKDGLFPCYGGNGLRGFTKTYTHNGVFPLIGRQGALCGNITLTKGQFHATEHAVVCSPEPNINVMWLYYQLVLLDLNQYATGQAQPGLSVKNLNDIPLRVPDSLKEQQKIADILSSLDNFIKFQDNKIRALKKHKQGLMQQLFPINITSK